LDISPVTRTVTVGSEEDLDIRGLTGVSPRWCGPAPVGAVECLVQLRAHGEPVPAVVQLTAGGLDVELRGSARGIAAGQAAVVYDGTRVIGSATIDTTRR
jgi:tRNA-specific 2-thiouridylase